MIPSKVSTKKIIPRYITVKLLKTKEKKSYHNEVSPHTY